MNMIPALPFRAEPWVEDENFNDAFAWMEEWHNPTASERRGSLLAAAGNLQAQPVRNVKILFALIPIKANDGNVKTIRPRIGILVVLTFSVLSVILIYGQQTLPPRYFSAVIEFDHVTTNKLLVKNLVGKETPSKMAYWVPGKARDYDNILTEQELRKLDWQPFKPEILADLGPGAGKRNVWVAVEWENPKEYKQEELGITVESEMPKLVITYPANRITSQPYLQLQGYCTGDMMNPQYDISNNAGKKSNQDASETDREFDRKTFDWSKFFFQAYDIELAPGTNRITFHCESAGNLLSTNIEIVFSTVGDTNPPIIKPYWPTNGMQLSGPTFTARGNVDDYTASLKGIISGDGRTNEINGLVERNGTFWVENIPLLAQENVLTFVATDAAGNSSQTNLLLTKSAIDLVIESTPTGDDLWKSTGMVAGRVTPGYDVYVNGTKAVVSPDGHWRAEKVPIYGMGTATFDATAVPSETTWAAKNSAAGIKNLLTAATDLKQEPIVINPGQSVCGTFAIHLTGTYKKKFVLMDSTNLLNWTPILTNFNSSPTFDYTDTNSANTPCRFFRVVPSP